MLDAPFWIEFLVLGVGFAWLLCKAIQRDRASFAETTNQIGDWPRQLSSSHYMDLETLQRVANKRGFRIRKNGDDFTLIDNRLNAEAYYFRDLALNDIAKFFNQPSKT